MANTKSISKEELWMKAYFEELKEAGFIKKIEYQPVPIILTNKVEVSVKITKQLKTKVKEITKLVPIIKERIYTMDFLIHWGDRNIFHEPISDDYYEENLPIFFSDMNRSCVEIKAIRDLQNTTRFFNSRTQPWIWEKYQIYINLIKVPEIFKLTFIPKEILHEFYYKKRTKKNKVGDKKYDWNYKTLEEYIKEI